MAQQPGGADASKARIAAGRAVEVRVAIATGVGAQVLRHEMADAARLERAAGLQVLELEKNLAATI